MNEDELFFVESLLGQVDWVSFSEKNQKRIQKIQKVERNIEEVKRIEKEKEEGGEKPKPAPVEDPAISAPDKPKKKSDTVNKPPVVDLDKDTLEIAEAVNQMEPMQSKVIST